ncbi:MAG: rhomboid family intramembrane serine protease [Chloroflexota bacterium]
MMPLRDLNPTRRFPIITYGLIAINVIIFLIQLTMPEQQLQQTFLNQAVVPASASAAPFSLETILDVIRSMFFHGGWEHIIGNMLYLYLFGDNIEDRLGAIPYLLIYFAGGFIAAFAQVIIAPTSQIPLIGASGAIAAVLGSYLVMFPGVKVQGIMPIGRISTMQEMPAWIVLGLWFVLQLFSGFGSLGTNAEYGGGVAFFAHIGGFIFGVVITLILMRIVPQPPAEDRRQVLYDRANRE